MFVINPDKSIYVTRGDIAVIELSASITETEDYIFSPNDVVRFKVYQKNRCEQIVLEKDLVVDDECSSIEISLTSEDTRIGELIHKPKDYWYEIEVNPDTNPQTIIGYDTSGPKVFRLYPEGGDKL